MPSQARLITSAALFVAAFFLHAHSLDAQQSTQSEQQHVPPSIQPPINEKLSLRLHATGNQIYTCTSEAGQFAWALKAPEAQLLDEKEQPFGKHFAGPSWQANDGSRVAGKVLTKVDSEDAESIPWLLIKVVSHEGNGILSRITTIQRLNTKGGKEPGSGCDADHVKQDVRVPYTADYLFYSPK
ncbi:MAG TPA: DUF3455 domain-containing protein [Candidatus Acidoferrum sp.]|jgi:hypothetical protein